MAADYKTLSEHLHNFYDFRGKTVLYVGAGGRQLLDPAVQVKRLVAIDKNFDSLLDLRSRTDDRGGSSLDVVAGRFEEVTRQGDVVYFEFCLHEMSDPEHAVRHAKTLASDIVIFDHLPGSEWVFYGAEEHEVERATTVMQKFTIRCRETGQIEQRFADYSELVAKLSVQGETAVERARCFLASRNIVIPMLYHLVLL